MESKSSLEVALETDFNLSADKSSLDSFLEVRVRLYLSSLVIEERPVYFGMVDAALLMGSVRSRLIDRVL